MNTPTLNLGDFWDRYEYSPMSESGFRYAEDLKHNAKGSRAGAKNKAGWYLTYYLDGKKKMITAHRVIWNIFNGTDLPPKHIIRFTDGNRFNVSPSNMTLETRCRMMQRTSKKFLGIQCKGNCWTLRMRINTTRYSFSFPTEEQAMRCKSLVLGEDGDEYLNQYLKAL